MLIAADLATIADAVPTLQWFPVRPWNRERVWAGVLALYLRADTKTDRDAFLKAVGVQMVLDAIPAPAGLHP